MKADPNLSFDDAPLRHRSYYFLKTVAKAATLNGCIANGAQAYNLACEYLCTVPSNHRRDRL